MNEDKQRANENSDLVGACMFLVHDHMGNCHERFDTLDKAVEHAEGLVEEYQDAAGDGWSGDGDIEVCQVVKRWSLVPIPTPEGKEGNWADLKEMDLPAIPDKAKEAADHLTAVVGSVMFVGNGAGGATISKDDLMRLVVALAAYRNANPPQQSDGGA